ncbi:uncharacterized protein LOC107273899 [Cephus cinctus]|uniref:Uncharacterized protein LOC107273899 n=1 Tax=Cephus cinctus TaxID=211228 RepID=A0AAJ7W707_CEPCN|nr:uncharacterized protein LOC107273899 [Cephus cinctus]
MPEYFAGCLNSLMVPVQSHNSSLYGRAATVLSRPVGQCGGGKPFSSVVMRTAAEWGNGGAACIVGAAARGRRQNGASRPRVPDRSHQKGTRLCLYEGWNIPRRPETVYRRLFLRKKRSKKTREEKRKKKKPESRVEPTSCQHAVCCIRKECATPAPSKFKDSIPT